MEKIITSPNSNTIPLPPWKDREVYARTDQRFGHNDFTLWPQFFHQDHRHLAAIPLMPSSSFDPLALLWWNVTPDHFSPYPGSTIAGFGELSAAKFAEMDALRKQLVARMLQHESKFSNLPPALQTLYKLMNHTLLRLTGHPTTIVKLQFTVAEFQRYFLEVIGYLDYTKIYEPRIQNTDAKGDGIPLPPTTALTIGAFTSDPSVVKNCFKAGLPVYFIRDRESVLNDHYIKIISVVDPIKSFSSLILENSDPPHPCIYQGDGEAGISQKFDEIHCYSRIWMFYSEESSSQVSQA